MTAEKYLVCHTCRSRVYACKNGRIDHSNDLASFIEDHEFDCEGKMEVCDESLIDDLFCYKNYYGEGRK